MIDRLHAHDTRILMDLVVNHTSDQYLWFKESRGTKTNPKRDWYIWRDPKYDAQGNRKEPNNWKYNFGGSAWAFDDHTGQYYLALFLPSQPDLNWESAEMHKATHDDMSKHPDLPDAKVINDEPYQFGAEFFASGPNMHDYIREIRTEVFDKYDVMTVGELGFTKDERSVSEYVANDRHELNMVFTGDIVDMDFGLNAKSATAMPKFDGWNTVYLDNHDSGRSLSQYASDAPEHRSTAAKMLATYLTTLSGTPFTLAGQEIGMANLGKDYGADAYIDVEGRNYYDEVLKSRGGNTGKMDDVLRELQLKSRDHGCLPMQCDSSPNAGFTVANAKPWMTINKAHTEWNVASQLDDPESIMAYWKQTIALRKEYSDLFVYGSYTALEESETGEMVLGYERNWSQANQEAVVLLNFSHQIQTVPLGKYENFSVLISSKGCIDRAKSQVELQPHGSVVLLNA
ncbi:glycoside hydrolase superfamily [Penicillium samsonianum]|uniref:glycoside hydrolase superfamily n=1 Tax=Penicillium samsonianum TaxID=1882272 RepID=UPI0025480633|nr:glycoside hydrolase superfamily [Penicillium samsonianum]KAJ6133161.1 glycoside hydrolase superfamily [Penicillium samsonianum]